MWRGLLDPGLTRFMSAIQLRLLLDNTGPAEQPCYSTKCFRWIARAVESEKPTSSVSMLDLATIFCLKEWADITMPELDNMGLLVSFSTEGNGL